MVLQRHITFTEYQRHARRWAIRNPSVFRRTRGVSPVPCFLFSSWTQSMHSYCVSRAAEHTPAPRGRAGGGGAELYCTTRQIDEIAAATVDLYQFGFDVRLKLFGAPRVVKLSRFSGRTERSADVGVAARAFASRCYTAAPNALLHWSKY